MEHTIRTFGRIHGKKLSARQQWLVDNLLPQLSPHASRLTPHENCGKAAILEIGFGAGEHILHLATTHPDATIIGAEPFINGAASLLSSITENWPPSIVINPKTLIKPEYLNIRIWPDDIRKLFTLYSSLSTLQNINFEKIYILHPDPWPKSRHEKRRLLSTEFLDLLAAYLAPGGKIVIATDHTDHFEWVLEQATKTNLKISNKDFFAPPESGLDTRYQRKNKFGSDRPMYLVLEKNHNFI